MRSNNHNKKLKTEPIGKLSSQLKKEDDNIMRSPNRKLNMLESAKIGGNAGNYLDSPTNRIPGKSNFGNYLDSPPIRR